MNKYIPSTSKWVRDQVELYEKSNGTEGNTVSDFPVMIVTNLGRKSGAIRKTPLITVKDGDKYVLIASLFNSQSILVFGSFDPMQFFSPLELSS